MSITEFKEQAMGETTPESSAEALDAGDHPDEALQLEHDDADLTGDPIPEDAGPLPELEQDQSNPPEELG
jgi:hypothetical protein